MNELILVIIVLTSVGCLQEKPKAEKFQLLLRWDLPAISDSGTNPKYLSVYQFSDNTTTININSQKYAHNKSVEAKKLIKTKTSDGLYFEPKTFQKIYKFLTSQARYIRFSEDEEEFFVDKFQDGNTPFHVIIKTESGGLNNRFYRGIYLDEIEYKFIISRASEIMEKSGY